MKQVASDVQRANDELHQLFKSIKMFSGNLIISNIKIQCSICLASWSQLWLVFVIVVMIVLMKFLHINRHLALPWSVTKRESYLCDLSSFLWCENGDRPTKTRSSKYRIHQLTGIRKVLVEDIYLNVSTLFWTYPLAAAM